MFKVKILVNDKNIDELIVFNTGETKQGMNLYRFEKPKELADEEIWHKRSHSWPVLLEKMMSIYNRHFMRKGVLNKDVERL